MAAKDSSIPDRMRAIVNYGPKDFRFCEDYAVPEKPEGGVLVRVTRCGICAGDAKCFEGAPKFWGDAENEKYVEAPVIPGHEFVGEVVAIDEKDSERFNIHIGDQVTSEQVVACRDCLYCKKGLRWLCEPHDIYGFHQSVPGGFAEYMTFPAHSIVHKIPKSIEPKYAAFVEPLSCGVHGVERGKVEAGDVVVVSGSGPIGLGMIGALKFQGLASRIIALDCFDERLEVAKACGADVTLNPTKTDVIREVKGMCGGYGCDVYLEASGAPASVRQGVLMTRKAGHFVEFSVFKDKTTLDWSLIGDTKELGSVGYSTAIKMLAQQAFPVDLVVTHDLPLRDCDRGIEIVNHGATTTTSSPISLKVILDPTLP